MTDSTAIFRPGPPVRESTRQQLERRGVAHRPVLPAVVSVRRTPSSATFYWDCGLSLRDLAGHYESARGPCPKCLAANVSVSGTAQR